MHAVPLKPEYGPTLGGLLGPRWRAASPPVRMVTRALAVAIVALLLALVLSLEDAQFIHRGPVAFNFFYRDLQRERPDAGGYARVARHTHGRLADSFSVEPLTVPDVPGSVSGVLPLAASAHVLELAQHDRNFVLLSEGKTKVNQVPAYAINYSTLVEGRAMDGRDVLIVAPLSGARYGVLLVMLTRASPLYTDGSPVGGSGVLHQPERTFTFGN